MTATLETIEREALRLPAEARAFLADRLLSSLGEEVLTEVDAAWIAEAEKRYTQFKSGERKPVSAPDVFKEADRILG
ncbi:MAG TPA: addiction module protein [Kiritimatiellia bacterium]|nr:addiction module protein [Kiritimatiellia bacterium]HMO99453.1 addiction module protein [Kiritimatiellia bacterium]HMP97259.1 addiction module protein [Kiritimatiellia bacterium]